MSPSTEQQKDRELLTKISELESELHGFKRQKKYGLVWEDKPEEVVLQCRENIPILKEAKTRRTADSEELPTNLLIEGDNYHAFGSQLYASGII